MLPEAPAKENSSGLHRGSYLGQTTGEDSCAGGSAQSSTERPEKRVKRANENEDPGGKTPGPLHRAALQG